MTSPDPILTATAEQTGDENTAAYVGIFRYQGWWYGLYKAEKAHGRDWLEWGPLARHGVIFAPELPWEAGDVRDPFLLVQGETLYLYSVGGHEQGIGLARAVVASPPTGSNPAAHAPAD
jgi:hypothetical protein